LESSEGASCERFAVDGDQAELYFPKRTGVMGSFCRKELPKRACRPESLVDTCLVDTVKRRRTQPGSAQDCTQDRLFRSRNQLWVASAARLYLREKLAQPRQSRISAVSSGTTPTHRLPRKTPAKRLDPFNTGETRWAQCDLCTSQSFSSSLALAYR